VRVPRAAIRRGLLKIRVEVLTSSAEQTGRPFRSCGNCRREIKMLSGGSGRLVRRFLIFSRFSPDYPCENLRIHHQVRVGPGRNERTSTRCLRHGHGDAKHGARDQPQPPEAIALEVRIKPARRVNVALSSRTIILPWGQKKGEKNAIHKRPANTCEICFASDQ